jgi:hypothetical protein
VSTVVKHLERQAASSRRLLGIVLAQGEAIRTQDVEGVLARLADVQAEMVTRQQLELEREDLLGQTARRLGVPVDAVRLDDVLLGVPRLDADRARAISAEVEGLIRETSEVHTRNQILIKQELSFLSHPMSVLSGAPQAGYLPGGWTPATQPAHTVDARA